MPIKNNNFLKKEILSIENLIEISKGLIQLGITKFRVTGGEPLIRRGIFEYLEFLNHERKKII